MIAISFTILSYILSGVSVSVGFNGERDIEYTFNYMPIKKINLNSRISYYEGKRQRGTSIYIFRVIGSSVLLCDENNDGQIENAMVGRNYYVRGQTGTEKMFQDADELLKYYVDKINFHQIVKQELARKIEIPRLK